MKFQVVLICLLGVTAINANGEFDYQEYPLRTTDALSPTQTVGVGGAGEYEDIPILLRTLLGIETPARHLLPPFEEPATEQEFSNGLYESTPFHNAPYWPTKQAENFRERRQFAPAPPRPYPYEVINRALPSVEQQIDLQPLGQPTPQQQQIGPATIDNVSAVKQSINDLESNISLIANTLLRENTAGGSEININVVLKLSPDLEKFLNALLLLADEKPEAATAEPSYKELEDLFESVYVPSRSQSNAANAAYGVDYSDELDDRYEYLLF